VTTPKRRAFTLLEMVVAVALFAVISIGIWNAYTNGMKQSNAAGEALTAIQSSVILMEAIQNDLRQMAVLNEPGYPLIPNSVKFSTNGKSIMLRKASITNYDGEMLGSSFTLVVYQLVQHPTIPGAFTMRRIERNTAGALVTDPTQAGNDTVFRSLILKDCKFDFLLRLEDAYSYRMFVRVSITAVNTGADQNDNRLYFVSNLFEAASPEFIHNSVGQVGFARRFLVDTLYSFGANEVKNPSGYWTQLPPPNIPDFNPFKDYVDLTGSPQDTPPPPAAVVSDPFDSGGQGSPRDNLLYYSTEYLGKLVGTDPADPFRGRILGQVMSRPGVTPVWVEPFAIDTTAQATQDVRTQLNELLGRIIPRGREAVEDMGHLMGAKVCPNKGFMIDDTDAQAVIANSYPAPGCP
jgi:prepilin-type N-terminal cleavage/methylation domain-containing protein